MGSKQKRQLFKIVSIFLLSLIFFIGAYQRVWYIYHAPINSDESIVGLMANQMLHGHFTAFYWGNTYGGSGEPVITAVTFFLIGQSAFALKLVPVLLSATSSILTYFIVLRVTSKRLIAALGGALVWILPTFAIRLSTIEGGFRALATVCGLLTILLSLRIIDGNTKNKEYLLWGLFAGIGWWSTPEIAYFLIPSSLILLGSLVKNRYKLSFFNKVKRLLYLLLSFGAGSLPWFWSNVQNGFLSLSTKSFSVPSNNPTYLDRINLFFKYSLPMLLNLRIPLSGKWVLNGFETTLALIVFIFAMLMTTFLVLKKPGRIWAILLSVIIFPFLLALSPATWFWIDGRYVSYLPYLLVILILVGASKLTDNLQRNYAVFSPKGLLRPLIFCLLSITIILISMSEFNTFIHSDTHGYVNHWSKDPNSPSITAIKTLETKGAKYGYAGYWTAYRLDFLSNERLDITGQSIARNGPSRTPSMDKQIAKAPYDSYIFVKSNNTASIQFEETKNLNSLTEQQFIAYLKESHIPYRIIATNLVTDIVAKNN